MEKEKERETTTTASSEKGAEEKIDLIMRDNSGKEKKTCDKQVCRWKFAVVIIALCAFLKEFRPSSPFLVDYAVDHQDFTADEVTHEIIPVTLASFIVSLSILVFITDILAYKPIIVLGGFFTVGAWSMTIWSYWSLELAKYRQILYGFGKIPYDLALFTYMVANVDEEEDFIKVLGYVHAAIHFGEFISGALGQLMYDTKALSIPQMNYLSLAGGILSLIVSLFLPRVLKNVDVSNKVDAENALPEGLNYSRHLERKKNPSIIRRWRDGPKLAKQSILFVYKGQCLLTQFTFWWILAYGLYIQVDLYAESLWKEVEHSSHQHVVWNGGVEAVHALISAGFSILIGHSGHEYNKPKKDVFWRLLFIGATFAQAVTLIVMSQANSMYVVYGAYIVFQILFQVLVIKAQASIAALLPHGSQAFIFCLDALMACIITAILTFSVTGKYGLRLPVRNQYIVLGGFATMIGIFLIAMFIRHLQIVKRLENRKKEEAMTVKIVDEEKGAKRPVGGEKVELEEKNSESKPMNQEKY